MASKTKRITHNNIHLFLSFVEREIQFRINVFIICYMIDGWGTIPYFIERMEEIVLQLLQHQVSDQSSILLN
jgi:hypothetical protein